MRYFVFTDKIGRHIFIAINTGLIDCCGYVRWVKHR